MMEVYKVATFKNTLGNFGGSLSNLNAALSIRSTFTLYLLQTAILILSGDMPDNKWDDGARFV